MLTTRLALDRLTADGQLLEAAEMPSRSFVRNFITTLYLMHAQILRTSWYELQDVDNVTRRVSCQPSPSLDDRGIMPILKIGAPGGLSFTYFIGALNEARYAVYRNIPGDKLGIIVGRGVNAVTPADYTLQTPCTQGTAANQFEYGGCEVLPASVSHPTAQFSIRRYLTNSSGGAITVNEVGIYCSGYSESLGADHRVFPVCIARDVVAGGIAVANTELLRVTYTIQVTV